MSDSPFYLTLRDFFDNSQLTIDTLCPNGLAEHSEQFPLRGIEVKGAVLFADLPGFSSYAVQATPAECVYVANHFFSLMARVGVIGTGGMLDNFIGDEILVVYLDSVTKGFSKELAYFSAMQMLEMDAFAFEPRIGIAHGEFIVAETGAESFTTISSIGHTVNLASRCVNSAPSRRCIRIADPNPLLIDHVFSSDRWEISSPKSVKFKNMPDTPVIDVRLTRPGILDFDYFARVREIVDKARKSK